jgi:hypothetical protein
VKPPGIRLLLLLTACLAGPALAFAQGEEILQFDSRIAVQTNGSMVVTETIRVCAQGDQIRHGIYRDFPQLYRGRWGLRTQTGFNIRRVQRDGRPEPCHEEDRPNGTRVYFGSATTVLSPGIYTYEFVYETDHQLGFFKAHDELYWNVTGNGWIFPIAAATATVVLPDGAEPGNLEAYTGAQGAKGKDYAAKVIDGHAHFKTTRPLGPGEGLTIVVGWPKGFVAQPASGDSWRVIISANKGIAFAVSLLLLAVVYYLLAWVFVGRDPKPGTIIPLYEPPKGFSPAAVRFLARMGFDNRTLTAAILNLAVKGKITIHEYQDKAYTLFRTDAAIDGLAHEEIGLLCKLFEDGPRLALLDVNYKTLQEATGELKERLAKAEEKIYFVRNLLYWIPGLLLVLAGLCTLLISAANAGPSMPIPWMIGVTVAGVFILVLFYYLLKAPTSKGRQILDQIEGFKLYLSVAEKDRLNLENPPERTPALFEEFLPYALALGVEQIWSEQFAAVLAAAGQDATGYSPGWYVGQSWTGTSISSMTSSMSSSLSSAIASASTAPGSSSGGGGGGCSGGGGGGGGGGGW